ncbi:hypothetical protein [Micromonospora rhizosphaerae]|uniref:hypothetical protein n=1 Tax=Micromonospora rhizosphaerae TaxID=568872 RepID=UPI00159F19EA|nr:hypothetical protein [Micromonospora rhizosphaerae]
MWSAAWSYAYTHGDGSRGVALAAFHAAASPRIHREDVRARLAAVNFSAGPEVAE